MLEKILKEKRKELGPLAEDDDVASPKLKLSKATSYIAICTISTLTKTPQYRLTDLPFRIENMLIYTDMQSGIFSKL